MTLLVSISLSRADSRILTYVNLCGKVISGEELVDTLELLPCLGSSIVVQFLVSLSGIFHLRLCIGGISLRL